MYCENCGKVLEDSSNYCSNCGAKVKKPILKCKKCGADVKEYDTICDSCGQPIERQASNTNSSYNGSTSNESYTNQTYTSENTTVYKKPKSKIVAGVLGILVGAFGIHRFYLGYIGIGVIQLVLLFLSCGASSLWGFIEGILILCGVGITTDADGVQLIE